MWIDWIFISLLVLPCAVSTSPPEPIVVSFSSVNLRNVLHWLPGDDSPDTKFTVEYAVYGEPIKNRKGKLKNWRPVKLCRKIARIWCDLSTEMQDVDQGYFARVRAIRTQSTSNWVLTPRFDPKSETVFGAPEVSVEIENNSAVISLKGPMRRLSNNHTSVLTPMKDIYHHMTYNLSIHNTHLNQMQHIPVVNSPYKYQLMEYNTKYCFSAKARFLSIQRKSESSVWHCITTPKDPVIEQLQSSLVGIVVPALCICVFMVFGYILYHYLAGNDQKSPYILNVPSFYPPPQEYPADVTNLVTIRELPRQCPKIPPNIILNPPPRYTSQNPEHDFEEDYGKVGRAEDGDDERDNLDNLNILTCEKPKHSVGVYAPQENTCVCRNLDHTGYKSQTPQQAESVPILQMHLWPEGSLTLPLQTLPPVPSSQESVTGERIDGESSGLFFSRNLLTSLFGVHLNMQKQNEVEDRRQTDGKEMGGLEERKRSENVPLLSGYAPRNVPNMPPVQSEESDFSEDYSCVVIQPEAQIAEQNESRDEREGGNTCNYRSNEIWQPELPQLQRDEETNVNSIFSKWELVVQDE